MPTILFLTNSELGQASVCLAVAHEFLLRPAYTIHIASFAPLRSSISQLNLRAISFLPVSSRSARVRPATFHVLTGPSMKQALEQRHGFDASKAFRLHGLGFQAACRAYRDVLAKMVAPWSGEEYIAVYRECLNVVEKVNPDLVVVDPLFTPGLDAVRSIGERFVVLSPNTFKEHVAQPKLGNLWKYPMYASFHMRVCMCAVLTGDRLCSGYPYPLPWSLMLPNALLALRLLSSVKSSPQLKQVERARKRNGIKHAIPDMLINPDDKKVLNVLLPGHAECEFPCFLPEKFTLCGPILRPYAPICDEHPDLAHWLAQRPTVLVSLGSLVVFTPAMERQFARGLRMLLGTRPDMQVLWKLPRAEPQSASQGQTLEYLSTEISEGRVRTMPWLPVEPICILQSGRVECIVHHGGANTFYEAIRAGVPQVVLPIWLDTYDFAHRVEYLGVGVWGNRQNAPAVKGYELGQTLKRMLASVQKIKVQRRAREVASELGSKEGRVVACEKIMEFVKPRHTWTVSFPRTGESHSRSF